MDFCLETLITKDTYQARQVTGTFEKRAPRLGVICGLSLLLVLVLVPGGFSPGTPIFRPLQNQYFVVLCAVIIYIFNTISSKGAF